MDDPALAAFGPCASCVETVCPCLPFCSVELSTGFFEGRRVVVAGPALAFLEAAKRGAAKKPVAEIWLRFCIDLSVEVFDQKL